VSVILRAMHSLALITATIVAATFAIMLFAEWRRPLRATVEPKPRRIARNFTVAALALGIGQLLHVPLLIPVLAWSERNRFGLLHVIPMPRVASVIVGVILLDYTLWWWHWLSHRVPLLWRFHLVHHVDRDLDASTAFRFHFGEHALSFVYRAAQIAILGVTPFSAWLWQAILFASILFHHSNYKLPPRVERWLVRVIVTPRMHGIHHADREPLTNSNWSSLLSCWDVLHRTLRLDVPDEEVVIGIPAYARGDDVTIGRILAMPFRSQKLSPWKK